MHTLTASEARANLYRLIDETTASHEPVVISGKRNSAVLISADDWSAIQETCTYSQCPECANRSRQGWLSRSQKVQKNLSGELDRCVCQARIENAKKLAASGLKSKAQEVLAVLSNDPFQNPPPFEKSVGDLSGDYSRRINIQHRIVYEVFGKEKTVRVLRMWTHY